MIILYMIRPRPRDLPFSSTVFISESEAQPSMAINRLITDPLFWIQLLIIILLVASAADPFTETKGIQSSHLVVVVDLSASMEASFDQAENIASRYISDNDRISIVLAENIPMVALREGNKAEAKMVLKSLSTRAVSADLSAGITSAKSLLGAEGGKILVISDFISWLGDDPEITRKLIEDDEVQVVFADSRGRGDNLAIVSGWIVESDAALNYSGLVRNFGNTKTVPIKISGPGGTTTTTRTIESRGDYYLTFAAYPGFNVISLE
ncbi:MAG: enhanced serine sensitivity protein SseB C-terminal domain-containing protein, partial [Alphaproteobacteria bacterium]|nr:enhanced serine sensitivity protein SseB C-terminal domain-containing protein [Alphaproteobacteria bacterium]